MRKPLDVETLAGGLLAMVDCGDPEGKESWRKRGQAFFQRRTRRAAGSDDRDGQGAEAGRREQAAAPSASSAA